VAAGDVEVDHEPVAGLAARIQRQVILDPRPGVEVELELDRRRRRPDRLAVVDDELEAASRARQRPVAERLGQAAAGRRAERPRADRDQVDIAGRRDPVAERRRPRQINRDEVVPERGAEPVGDRDGVALEPRRRYSPQRNPVALGAGSSGLSGRPSGTLGSL
jgi:hypothetical protein